MYVTPIRDCTAPLPIAASLSAPSAVQPTLAMAYEKDVKQIEDLVTVRILADQLYAENPLLSHTSTNANRLGDSRQTRTLSPSSQVGVNPHT